MTEIYEDPNCYAQKIKGTDDPKKKRTEYEFINGYYITPSELKIRRKTKKSKGGKNIKITDFPITGAAASASASSPPKSNLTNLSKLLSTTTVTKKKIKNAKKVKKQKAAAKANISIDNTYGYSELEAILKADDSIITDPDKDILEWADSVLNPYKICNFTEDELSIEKESDEDEEEEDIIQISDDSSDECEYIPPKAASQHRVGVCPKCSSTQKLVNFVWDCECSKKDKPSTPSKWDISDKYFGIVNDWTLKKQPQGYTGIYQSANKSAKLPDPFEKKSYASATRGKIYEKKKVQQRLRGKDINLLTNKLGAVSLNQNPSNASKKPILRSLLTDDPTWALPNPMNFSPPKSFYDLIYEPESRQTPSQQQKDFVQALGFTTSKSRPSSAKKSEECPLLRDLLTSPTAISQKHSSTQTQPSPTSESPSTSEFNVLKAELAQEKLHRMTVEAKVAALEMKFSQCLSLLEDTVPTLTAKLNNISLTCDHINLICENTKVEKQSALKELNAAKERIEKLENQQAKFQQRNQRRECEFDEVTVSTFGDDPKLLSLDTAFEDIGDLNPVDVNNDEDDDDKDSEYSFVY